MERWLETFARAMFRRSGDTAQDVKTPLNVAVRNLELLRMRLRKLTASEDEKIAAYAVSIDVELRRMARIFDTFFLLSTPPKDEGEPVGIDIAKICAELAAEAGYEIAAGATTSVRAHESRIRQAFKMFFDGASRVLTAEQRRAVVTHDSHFRITVSGGPVTEDFELTKVLKFYYTDPAGNPDLSFAAARLIAETYGGELIASEESDKVSISMAFPLGAQ